MAAVSAFAALCALVGTFALSDAWRRYRRRGTLVASDAAGSADAIERLRRSAEPAKAAAQPPAASGHEAVGEARTADSCAVVAVHADGSPGGDGGVAQTPDSGVTPPAEAPQEAAAHTLRIAPMVSTDPDQVLDALLEEARPAADCVCAHLWLQDPPTGNVRMVAARGEMRPSGAPVGFQELWVSPVVMRGEAVLTPLAVIRDSDDAKMVWRFAFPVPSGSAPGVACLDIRSFDAPATITLEPTVIAYQPALSAALALHVAKTESERAGRLLESARDLSRRLQADDVIERALDAAVTMSSAASASIMLPEGPDCSLRIVGARGLPDEVVRETRVAPGEGIAGWVFEQSKPLLVEDLDPSGPSRRRGVRSAVCVPLADEDGIMGVLSVGSRDYPAHFTESNMTALDVLGRQTAVALRNAMALSSATDLYFSTLTALAVALETKDPYALGGTRRVAELAIALGEHAGLADDDLQALHVAALLHDVGMTIAGSPLGATTRPLTTVERGMLKAHPVVAAQVLGDVPSLTRVVPLVYHHHEWYDGHGYVAGLAGEDIPVGSRLLAVADAFVAMTSDRPYRRAMSVSDALEELRAKSGTQFDPVAVEDLREVLDQHPELATVSEPSGR